MAWASKGGDITAEKAFEVKDIENVSPIIMQLLHQFGDDFIGRTFYGRRKYKVKRISHNQWRSYLRGRDCSLTIEKALWGDYWRILLDSGDSKTKAFSLPFKREQNIMAFGFALTSELSKVYSEWRK